MVVNSINFWFFFIIVLVCYYGLCRKSARWQNSTLLIASYIFYGMVNWKMCLLLFAATVFFYGIGIAINRCNHDNPKRASQLTSLGVCIGVGMLVYFKYLNFFLEEFSRLLSTLGLNTNWISFKIIMPLGISFFTFKLIGYVIEVHRENMKPSKDPIAFGTFIAFFPTLMSGPIDNPSRFLPQLDIRRSVDYEVLVEAGKRVLWGMFLKMCIADQLSGYTSAVLENYQHHNATSIIIASFLFSFQLYSDFCGYSHMAIGVSQIMGIKVSENFNRPFFSQNMAEWWRRWHMSLTTWITNYIYMPLSIAFRDWGMLGICAAAIINLIIIGIWHGDNWTYALFGLYHGIVLAIVTLLEKPRKKFEKKHNLKKNFYYVYTRMLLTFIIWTFGQVLFQAASVPDFMRIVCRIGSGWGAPFITSGIAGILPVAFSIICMLIHEFWDENKKEMHVLHSKNKYVSILSSTILICYIIMFGSLNGGSFIYFQF